MTAPSRLMTLVSLACALPNLSMTHNDLSDIYGILDNEDYLMMENQGHPALGSVTGDSPSWESYNRWLCFPAEAMTLDCRDHESDQSWNLIAPEEREGMGFYAVMDVSHEGLYYRLESPGWLSHEKCHQQIDEIQELLDGQNGICIFAADIPSEEELSGNDESNSSAWVFYGIKTLAGKSMAPIYETDDETVSDNVNGD